MQKPDVNGCVSGARARAMANPLRVVTLEEPSYRLIARIAIGRCVRQWAIKTKGCVRSFSTMLQCDTWCDIGGNFGPIGTVTTFSTVELLLI